MFKITRVGVVSLGFVMAVAQAVIGLIIGLFVTIMSIFGASVLSSNLISGGMITIVGFGAVIIFPIIFAIVGFIQGAIVALIFNLAVKLAKGLQLEIEEMDEAPQKAQPKPQAQQQVKK